MSITSCVSVVDRGAPFRIINLVFFIEILLQEVDKILVHVLINRCKVLIDTFPYRFIQEVNGVSQLVNTWVLENLHDNELYWW